MCVTLPCMCVYSIACQEYRQGYDLGTERQQGGISTFEGFVEFANESASRSPT